MTHSVTTNLLLFSLCCNDRFEDWNSVVSIIRLGPGLTDCLVNEVHMSFIPHFEAIETVQFLSPLTVISVAVVGAVSVA